MGRRIETHMLIWRVCWLNHTTIIRPNTCFSICHAHVRGYVVCVPFSRACDVTATMAPQRYLTGHNAVLSANFCKFDIQYICGFLGSLEQRGELVTPQT